VPSMGICNPRNMQLGFPSQAGFVGKDNEFIGYCASVSHCKC